MPRYSLYEGVPGFLCPHPAAEVASRRHPGMKRRPLGEGEDFVCLVDLYDPIPEVHEEHRCLQKAAAVGQLKRLKGPIVAKNHMEAIAKLMPAPVAAPAPKAKAKKENS